jgi:hypothetical protein
MRAAPLVCASTLAALLAACASAPIAPRETAPTTHALREEPLRAAACIARNVDRYPSRYSAQIVPGEAPAIAAVIIRGARRVATARLMAAGPASVVEIERTAEPLFGLDELLEAMVLGC